MAANRFTEPFLVGNGPKGHQPASLALGGRQCWFSSGDEQRTSVGAALQGHSGPQLQQLCTTQTRTTTVRRHRQDQAGSISNTSDVSGKFLVRLSAGTQTLDVFRDSLQSRHANAVTPVSHRRLTSPFNTPLFFLLPQIFLAVHFTI